MMTPVRWIDFEKNRTLTKCNHSDKSTHWLKVRLIILNQMTKAYLESSQNNIPLSPGEEFRDYWAF